MKSLLLQLQGLLKTISILDVLDILVVAYFLFRIYLMLKNTRAATLVKGLLVLAVILFISKWLNLHVITAFGKKYDSSHGRAACSFSAGTASCA